MVGTDKPKESRFHPEVGKSVPTISCPACGGVGRGECVEGDGRRYWEGCSLCDGTGQLEPVGGCSCGAVFYTTEAADEHQDECPLPWCPTCNDAGFVQTTSREWGVGRDNCPDCNSFNVGDEPGDDNE